MNLRPGGELASIRNDEGKAGSIGINTTVYKVTAYTLSAIPFGAAGALYGQYLGFVNPLGAFAILTSVYLVLAALIGGRGTLWGPVIGGFIVALANEFATTSSGGVSALVLIMGMIPTRPSCSARAAAHDQCSADPPNGEGGSVKFIDQASIASSSEVDTTLITAREQRGSALGDTVLEIRDLVKTFGGVTAVDGVSLSIRRGSITGLIGPNGSGKTTSNWMTGTLPSDVRAGAARRPGHHHGEGVERADDGLGRTFQITRLFKSMTVLDNLVAPLERTSARQMVAGRYSGDEVDRARDVLAFMGLG